MDCTFEFVCFGLWGFGPYLHPLWRAPGRDEELEFFLSLESLVNHRNLWSGSGTKHRVTS